MNSLTNTNKILIIEKSTGGAFLLISILTKHHFEIKTVNSYLKAVEYCSTQGYFPDLIIVDQPVPCAIFFEFPRKFQERTLKKIPILAYTLSKDKEVIDQALKSGYQDFIVRPSEPEIILDKISSFVHPGTPLSEETYPFLINEGATIEMEAHLDFINEFGATIKTKHFFGPGMYFSLKSKTLAHNGVDELRVCVVDSYKNNDAEYGHTAKLSFLGLNSKELESIRRIAIHKGYRKAV